MTKAEFQRFTREYVRPLADDVGLRDWEIRVDRATDDLLMDEEDVVATCAPWYGRKIAVITLYPKFFEADPEEQLQTLIHEFMHCHLAGVKDIVSKDLKKHLGEQGFDIFYDSFIRSLEYAVDGIAMEITKWTPLP